MFRCHTTRSHLHAGCGEGHQVCYEMTWKSHFVSFIQWQLQYVVFSFAWNWGILWIGRWASLFIFCFHRAVFHLAIMSSMLLICSKSLECMTGLMDWRGWEWGRSLLMASRQWASRFFFCLLNAVFQSHLLYPVNHLPHTLPPLGCCRYALGEMVWFPQSAGQALVSSL